MPTLHNERCLPTHGNASVELLAQTQDECQAPMTHLKSMPESRQSIITVIQGQQSTHMMAPYQPPLTPRPPEGIGSNHEKYVSLARRYHTSSLDTTDQPARVNHAATPAMRLLKKDLGALMNFMSVIPLASLAIALYTILVTLLTFLMAPINLCISKRNITYSRLRKFLVTATNLHYKCAWSSSNATPHNVHRSWPGSICTDMSDEEAGTSSFTADAPSNSLTIIVFLLSPLVSIPMAFAAFVVAIWWIMSAITADDKADGFSDEHPKKEGQGGFDEGQRYARGLRQWWIGWLSGDELRRRF